MGLRMVKIDVLQGDLAHHAEVMLLMLTSSVDKGSGVVDEGRVRAGNSLVLHVSVVLMGEAS